MEFSQKKLPDPQNSTPESSWHPQALRVQVLGAQMGSDVGTLDPTYILCRYLDPKGRVCLEHCHVGIVLNYCQYGVLYLGCYYNTSR